jgi:hypothetical protein
MLVGSFRFWQRPSDAEGLGRHVSVQSERMFTGGLYARGGSCSDPYPGCLPISTTNLQDFRLIRRKVRVLYLLLKLMDRSTSDSLSSDNSFFFLMLDLGESEGYIGEYK